VIRVKEESGNKKDSTEIVLTLSDSVTAKEIMKLLKVNHFWRVSGNSLRIDCGEIVRRSGEKTVEWVGELAKEVAAMG